MWSDSGWLWIYNPEVVGSKPTTGFTTFFYSFPV